MNELTESIARRRLGRLLGQLGPLLALVVVYLSFGAADQARRGEKATFLSVNNVRNMSEQTVVVATAALGMTIVIVSGGIDLSAGTALALSATTLAWCLRENYGPAAALAAALGIGGLAGLLNGVLISLLRVVPFIITLGTMTVFLGLAKLLSDGSTVQPRLEQVPAWLSDLVLSPFEPKWLVEPVLPNFSPAVWIVVALAAASAAMLKFTVFGRYVFAVGSNEPTARLCGINVPLVKIAVYTLAGLFLGAAGVLQFSRLSSGDPTSGTGLELKIIAAVVIGGGSLSGGRGSILGTVAGAALMVVISSGCNILAVSNAVQDIVIGAIIIAAVTLDQIRRRRTER
jgi:ribose transport system permease protein